MEIYITKIILPCLSETKGNSIFLWTILPCYFLIILKGSVQKNCWSCWTVIMLMLFWYHLIAHADRLQSLDLSVNKAAKEILWKKVQNWYATEVCAQLDGKLEREALDLRLSIIKPLGAKLVIELYGYLKGKPDIIMTGFR